MNLNDLALNGGLFSDGDWIEKKDQDENGTVRLIQLADIGTTVFKNKSNKFITVGKCNELNCTKLNKNDILIARLPEPLGRSCIFPLEGDFITAVDITVLRISRQDINTKYIMYLINSPCFREQINKYESGTTRKRISRKNLAKIEFSIPTISEQNKVVSDIEELFSELDKAEKTLLKIKAQLEVYKQAVLKEAFEEKKIVEISEIVDDIKIGPFGTMLHQSDYVVNGVPVINPQNIKENKIVPSNKNSITKEKSEKLHSYRLLSNDIVMGRRGEMGRTAPVTEQEDGWICGTGSILFRLKKDFDAKFYAKVLSSPNVVHYLEENATGTTMKNLNEKIVKHIPVPYLTKTMQEELFKSVDEKMSTCLHVGKDLDFMLLQIQSLRQSILKEAFEGKLV